MVMVVVSTVKRVLMVSNSILDAMKATMSWINLKLERRFSEEDIPDTHSNRLAHETV